MTATETPDVLTKRQIDAIKQIAIDKWGEDKWLASLVRSYAVITGADPRKRYAQISRLFEEGKDCNLSTLNGLLLAVDCRLKLVCIDVKEKEF
ncbi:hypothetical protein [Tumidithrix helvetica]|uniref:hypothetical protein n=1 Tax=Tumidithrix helvetica TaxID=3457545 RepID=UPI003CC6D7D7